MPAALTVDQTLVDNFLARINRFADNVNQLEETLAQSFRDRFTPETTTEKAVYQETAHQETTAVTKPEQGVVTADDIDIEALLAGVDLENGQMSM